MNYSNHPATKDFRALLRKYETPQERMMWKRLKGRQLEGYKFRQQHGFGPYVMDFYCPELRLCIEIDGNVHDSTEQIEKDRDRTTFLNENRIHVVRFTNDEIETDMEGVIERIKVCITGLEAEKLVQTPNPLT